MAFHATLHGLSHPNRNRPQGQGRQEAHKGVTSVASLEGEGTTPLPLPKVSPQARRHVRGVNLGDVRV